MYALNNGSFKNVTNVSNSLQSVSQSVSWFYGEAKALSVLCAVSLSLIDGRAHRWRGASSRETDGAQCQTRSPSPPFGGEAFIYVGPSATRGLCVSVPERDEPREL